MEDIEKIINIRNKKEYDKQNYKNNKEKIDKRNRLYRLNNPEKIRELDRKWIKNNLEKTRAKWRNWVKNHRYKVNDYKREKYKTDLKYNLTNKMRNLIKHLKKTIPESYTWKDYLEGRLQIDHKIPISVFNFSEPEHTDFKRCWTLKNLRLLPARENLMKNAKLTRPFQPALKLIIKGVN